jgi:amino acid adenylation domain-containing protein
VGIEGQEAPETSKEISDGDEARLRDAIAAIWREILELSQVTLEEDFFELGGDSLAAVRMLAVVEDRLEAQVSFVDFLDAPTVASLARALRRGDGSPYARPAESRPVQSGEAPASYAQERLWFLEELEGSTSAYNMPIGVRVRGELDVTALERSLREVVRRHAALRTSFSSREGRLIQIVSEQSAPELEQIDVREHPEPEAEAQRLVDRLASAPLALERAPLMRALLVRLAAREHVLELVFHHMVCDGSSQVTVMRELGLLYRAYRDGDEPELAAPRSQFPEQATRERESLVGEALDRAVAPWVKRLDGAPATLSLPSDRLRPQFPSYRGATHRVRLSHDQALAIRSFARSAKATPFATLLAVYFLLLSRYSGQDDIVVGATTSGRDRPELEDGVGLFASTVALRCELAGAASFRELVVRVRNGVLWALAHEQAPFEQIVARLGAERDLSRHPVFQVFCAHVPEVPFPVRGTEPYDARPSTSRFDLTLFVEEERDQQLELAWEYSTDLFDQATIEQMAANYVALLEAALAGPDRPAGDLPMLGPARPPDGAGAPQRADFPVACMHQQFERFAARTPDAPALTFEGASVTYGELNARANQLAHHLRSLGAGLETMVALFLEPSVELVVAILGALKAGAAYVPLDPAYPAERIGFVLRDTGAPLLVTQEDLLERLPETAAHTVCMDRDRAAIAAGGSEDLDCGVTPENLAYVIYTSGSTGRPKGVMVEHRNVARLFSATDGWYGFGPFDVWVLMHSYAFDFSVWELWGALAYGGRLVISPLWTTRSPEALAGLISESGVTVMNATPSLFVAVQEELLHVADRLALRYVVFGGEALVPAVLRPWFEHFGEEGPALVNMYGITETTVHVTYRPIRPADCERDGSPIGIPIPDLSVHLLDARGVPVPPGVPGELHVGGAGVARGYLNRPELTAQRFIADPFGPGRLYRAGDLARRLANGELDFRGRIDDQVKIRGFRIELGEVQAAIREVSGVSDCAVVAAEASPGDTRLAAYVVGEAGPDLREAVISQLQRRLPEYMVPASITLLDRLPLTRNGKTDRKALPPPVWELHVEEGRRVLQTPTEELIAEIWRSVLGIAEIGREDNFFSLGGHSLLAARVVTKVREFSDAALSVRTLFERPTLAEFAAHVDSVRPAAVDEPEAEPAPGVAAAAGDACPLSFQQQQLLFFDALEPGSVTYNAALAIGVVGELDVAALRRGLEAMFGRHEALRTVLVWDEDAGRQVVLDRYTVELAVIDLSRVAPAERDAELEALIREHARRPFDLSRELMMRTTLLRLGPAEHVLLFQAHHVAFDAWAVEVFYRDLGELYEAARERRAPVLPELPQQYRDFSRWQRQRLRGEFLDGELDFWRAQLAGAPAVLRLPTDKRRPPSQTFDGATHTVVLDGELATGVRELCRAEHVTPYMLLLSAFATLLYRRSGQDDILFGGPMANRDQPGLDDLIGFFANTIVVRVKLAGNPTFLELLASVRESVLASYEHQEVPLELVVDAVRPPRHPGVNPLVQVNFRVRVGHPPVLALAGATTRPVPVDLGLARFDLALELRVLEDGIEAEWGWNTDLFERETMLRLASDFKRLLGHSVADPSTRLLSFELAAAPSAGRGNGATTKGPAGVIRAFRQAGGLPRR